MLMKAQARNASTPREQTSKLSFSRTLPKGPHNGEASSDEQKPEIYGGIRTGKMKNTKNGKKLTGRPADSIEAHQGNYQTKARWTAPNTTDHLESTTGHLQKLPTPGKVIP